MQSQPGMSQKAHELNIDGLVGPTHSYGGLSWGNIASGKSRLTISNPRAAALQGLRKMKFLFDLGLKQAVFPPQERPDIVTLRRLGFSGPDPEVLRQARDHDPHLLEACSSASSMWMANAATVSPSTDTADHRVHFTPANLVTQFHRSIEPDMTATLLKAIFSDKTRFAHHSPLPRGSHFRDEGAANHIRLCRTHAEPGVELFVYGTQSFSPSSRETKTFPARQSLEASHAVARLHHLDLEMTRFALQNPDLIDAGVFHNDVISVGNENVLLYHSLAFSDGPSVARDLQQTFSRRCQGELSLIEIPENRLSISDAIGSYVFNSQLLSLPDGSMALVSPIECQESSRVRSLIEELIQQDNPVQALHYIDVRQSMKNGGGPACLRLRVVVSEDELTSMHQAVLFSDQLYAELSDWVTNFYRDRLELSDLVDPDLLQESRTALDSLTQILQLGSVYPFQLAGAS